MRFAPILALLIGATYGENLGEIAVVEARDEVPAVEPRANPVYTCILTRDPFDKQREDINQNGFTECPRAEGVHGCCVSNQDDRIPGHEYDTFYTCTEAGFCIKPGALCVPFSDGTADCGCQNPGHPSC